MSKITNRVKGASLFENEVYMKNPAVTPLPKGSTVVGTVFYPEQDDNAEGGYKVGIAQVAGVSICQVEIKSSSWVEEEELGRYRFEIPYATHSMGNAPAVETYIMDGDDLLQTYDSPKISSDGKVTVYTSTKVDMFVRIRYGQRLDT